MIELKNVSKFYKGQTVAIGLKNINLQFAKNEFVAIVGPSGAGKSTLLNVICGMDSYDEGEIYFKGNETSYFNDYDRDIFRKQNVAIISQNYNLINSYTVLDNVLVPLYIKGLSNQEAKQKALEYIEKVGLSKRIKSRVSHLSGGEKQRCVIARALATECDILACDEPTGNLDSHTGEQIISLIKEISKDKLVLMVTHNYQEIAGVVTRTITIKDGEVVEDAKKEEITDQINEPLNLVDTKIKSRNFWSLLIQNICKTPRRTFFISIVYFILAVVFLFLTLSCITIRDESNYLPNKNYINNIYNRLMVFDKDHQPLDMEKLDKIAGPKFTNAFYEDIVVSFSMPASSPFSHSLRLNGSFCYYLPQDVVLVDGNLPSKAGDLFYIFDDDQVDSYRESLDGKIGQKMTFNNLILKDIDFNLCGYGYAKSVNSPLIYSSEDYTDELKSLYFDSMSASIVVNGEMIENIPCYRHYDFGKTTLTYSGPKEIENPTLILNLNSYNYTITDFEYIYQPSPIKMWEVNVNIPYELNEVYEVVIYPDDLDKAIKVVEKAGYIAVTPGRQGVDKSSDEYLRFLEFLLIAVISISVLTLIGFFIISRIFENKNREYAILRSVGLIGNDLRKLIYISTVIISVIITIIVLIIFLIGSLFKNSIFTIMRYNNIGLMIGFFLYMIVLALLIGLKVNRRIKRLNLSSTLKSEV